MATTNESGITDTQKTETPVEDEQLVPDNRTDSDATSLSSLDSASISSSVLNYTYDNGRRYQSLRSSDTHFLPNDEAEQDRLDLLHHVCLLILNGRLYTAPIPEGGNSLKRILDLGTGTGIWATQIADEYPDAQVVGVDISPIQSSWVPHNVRFYVDDVEETWTFNDEEKFDFIHERALSGSLKDWPALFQQAFQHLKPGGWYEAQEYTLSVTSDDGTHENAVHIHQWCEQVTAACEQSGRPIQVTPKLRQWLTEAGFVDIHEEVHKVPFNPWPKDPRMKEIGKYNLVQAMEAAESFILQLFPTVLGKTMEETKAFAEKCRVELADRRHHIYAEYHFISARKPEGS